MNEIKKCSIAGISFTLEKSAYETLQAYIKSLNDTYKENPDGEEIVAHRGTHRRADSLYAARRRHHRQAAD